MKWLLTVALLLAGLMTGCARDPHEKFVGYWSSSSPKQLFRIHRDGEAMLIQNLMPGPFGLASGSDSIALSKSGDELRLNGPGGSATLALGEDGNRLYLFNMTLQRIADAEAQRIVGELEIERERWLQGVQDCQRLGEEFKASSADLKKLQTGGGLTETEFWTRTSTLMREFQARAAALTPRCYLPPVPP